jgi:hypothetical protein
MRCWCQSTFLLTAQEVAYALERAGALLLCAGPDMLNLARDTASREIYGQTKVVLLAALVKQQKQLSSTTWWSRAATLRIVR